ncbi:hypothetical protein M3Y94_00404400 [Aphelenchoides besseyi]|nr:hypothetical protein M3Y94_00404400 [Aphelenchoides besseyi]KAI6217805.1 hypothetical protein M3Y95_01199300 [Aphelenchoides besseyi]
MWLIVDCAFVLLSFSLPIVLFQCSDTKKKPSEESRSENVQAGKNRGRDSGALVAGPKVEKSQRLSLHAGNPTNSSHPDDNVASAIGAKTATTQSTDHLAPTQMPTSSRFDHTQTATKCEKSLITVEGKLKSGNEKQMRSKLKTKGSSRRRQTATTQQSSMVKDTRSNEWIGGSKETKSKEVTDGPIQTQETTQETQQ